MWHKNPVDAMRFKYLVDGTHLVMPFQCPLCHFRNLTSRTPGSAPGDAAIVMHIIRAILDAGWGREPGTIRNHLNEVRRNIRKCLDLVKPVSYPPFGSIPHQRCGRNGSSSRHDHAKLGPRSEFDVRAV